MSIGGKDTVWLHASHGSPSSNVSYTAKTMSVVPNFNGEEVDATTFGDAFRESEQTFKSFGFAVRYKYDATIWQIVADLWTNGTSITFELGPVGVTAPNPKITGSMYLQTFSEPFNVGELQVLDVTFKGTGAPTFGAYS